MKHVIPAAIALSLLAGGLAQAQTTTTTPPANTGNSAVVPGGTTTGNAGRTTATGTTTGTNAATGNALGNNGPNSNAVGATTNNPSGVGTTNNALGTNATGAPNNRGSSNAAVNTSGDASHNPSAPVPGANSFTEGEARSRIQDKGFGQVTNLKKDDQGIWRGTATKDGKTTNVALDYQGNVVAQ